MVRVQNHQSFAILHLSFYSVQHFRISGATFNQVNTRMTQFLGILRATLCDSRLNNEARLQIKNNFVIKLEVEGTVIDWKSEKPIF